MIRVADRKSFRKADRGLNGRVTRIAREMDISAVVKIEIDDREIW
jgi:hypothetical protein